MRAGETGGRPPSSPRAVGAPTVGLLVLSQLPQGGEYLGTVPAAMPPLTTHTSCRALSRCGLLPAPPFQLLSPAWWPAASGHPAGPAAACAGGSSLALGLVGVVGPPELVLPTSLRFLLLLLLFLIVPQDPWLEQLLFLEQDFLQDVCSEARGSTVWVSGFLGSSCSPLGGGTGSDRMGLERVEGGSRPA